MGLPQSQPKRTRKRTHRAYLLVDVGRAVVFARGSLILGSPTCAGVTGEARSSAFWYTPRPSAWASDTTFQPLETMRGYALIKLATDKSDNSCSRITRPGVLGPCVFTTFSNAHSKTNHRHQPVSHVCICVAILSSVVRAGV